MATVNYAAGACPALVFTQNQIMGQNDPNNLIVPIGLVQALKDPANVVTAEFEQLGGGDGHLKAVRLTSRKPLSPALVTDARACDTGNVVPRQEELVTMDLTSHLALRVSEADIRGLCSEYSNYRRLAGMNMQNSEGARTSIAMMREVYDVVEMGFSPMLQNINTKLNTAMATRFGEWVDESTVKTYEVLTGEPGHRDGAPILNGFNLMMQDLRKTTFTGQPITWGSGVWERANTALGFGCCNDGGVDFGRMAGAARWKYYVDDTAPTALGNANAIGAFFPGTAHLLHFNKYVGNFARPIGTMERGTIAVPSVPGLRFDIRISPNECGEYYDVYLDLDFKLWTAQTTMFDATDYRNEVNGILKIIAAEYTPA